MAATYGRVFVLSRVVDLSSISLSSPFIRQIPLRIPALHPQPAVASSTTVSCLSGGVSDEFVSTRKSSLDRGFSVIANMLNRIEPLDNSVISKGVPDSAKDSMKQTISTMLGLIPSDQFSVMVRVSKHPLYRLLFSSIITGYTLWNAEYRISLMRNFDIPSNSFKSMNSIEENEATESKGDNFKDDDDHRRADMDRIQVFNDLLPEAANYMQQLQLELDTVKRDLNAQKQETEKIKYGKESTNNLLDYLRSLDPDMVNELSQPSSLEVEEIIQQLVQTIVLRLFKSDSTNDLTVQHCEENLKDETFQASRDYLAKLLFWCMLLGHHLRGLENRLHLSCVVGLL